MDPIGLSPMGMEMVRQVMSNFPDCKVVVLTANQQKWVIGFAIVSVISAIAIFGGTVFLNAQNLAANGPYQCVAHNPRPYDTQYATLESYEQIDADCGGFRTTCIFQVIVDEGGTYGLVYEGQSVTLYRAHNKPGATYTDSLSDWECN